MRQDNFLRSSPRTTFPHWHATLLLIIHCMMCLRKLWSIILLSSTHTPDEIDRSYIYRHHCISNIMIHLKIRSPSFWFTTLVIRTHIVHCSDDEEEATEQRKLMCREAYRWFWLIQSCRRDGAHCPTTTDDCLPLQNERLRFIWWCFMSQRSISAGRFSDTLRQNMRKLN